MDASAPFCNTGNKRESLAAFWILHLERFSASRFGERSAVLLEAGRAIGKQGAAEGEHKQGIAAIVRSNAPANCSETAASPACQLLILR